MDKAIRMSIIGTGNKNRCRREKMRLLAVSERKEWGNQVVCVCVRVCGGEVQKK